MSHLPLNPAFPHSGRATRNGLLSLLIALAAIAVSSCSTMPTSARMPGEQKTTEAPKPVTRMIDMGGYKLRIRTAGQAGANLPTVVFESGLGTPLENWKEVQRDVARETATFAYDRAGIGRSDSDHETPTIKHIVSELHALLAKAKIPPPYVLVGHSSGGPAVRLFAAHYPGEVAGLVFVDPSDWKDTGDQELRAFAGAQSEQ